MTRSWVIDLVASCPLQHNRASFLREAPTPSSASGLLALENLGRLRSLSVEPIRQCVAVKNGVKRIAIGGEQRFQERLQSFRC